MGFVKTEKQVQACRLMNAHAYTLLYGGSRSAKTSIIIRNIFLRALKASSRHLIVRFRFNHAKTSLWYDTIPKVLKMCFPGLVVAENKSDWFYEVSNSKTGVKSTVWLGGIDDKDRTEKILGNEYSTIFANEVSQIKYDSILMLQTRLAENSGLKLKFYLDCNPPGKKHWTYQEFFEKFIPGTKEQSKKDSACLMMNPTDNVANLPSEYLDALRAFPKRQRQRFLEGLFLDDVDGAIWKQEDIDRNRVTIYPRLVRIVVAIDPAVTKTKTSDETGIVVVGLGEDRHGYVLEDSTGKYSPNEWANKAVNLYRKWQADRIVGETNNGGDLVEINIRSVDQTVSYKAVHASRGKEARAEPVEALYERDMVHHVGDDFVSLEDQQCTWVPNTSDGSPNNMDALVWGIWDLMLSNPGIAATGGRDPLPKETRRTERFIEQIGRRR